MNEIKLTIRPFEMGTEKEAALKPLEEAAEVYSAWQEIDRCGGPKRCKDCEVRENCESPLNLADEIADTIQASCNLAARYDINLQAAMERCERRNRGRGRYEDAKPCGACGGNDCDCGGSCGDVPDGDDAPKSPEEMSVEELIEALYIANGGSYYRNNSCSCTKNFDHDWCKGHGTCTSCRERLLDLLKAAHEREVASLEYEKSYYKEKTEAYERDYDDARRRITDLTHERDELRNRLAELSDAGITSLHRLLREAMGEAKNITHNARVYINKQQGSKDEHCGNCGSVWRDHGGDCGAECAGEHILSAKPPAQEISEREAAIERLRELELTEENMSLDKIMCAVLGHEPATWWSKKDRVALRDKLIELLGGVNDAG